MISMQIKTRAMHHLVMTVMTIAMTTCGYPSPPITGSGAPTQVVNFFEQNPAAFVEIQRIPFRSSEILFVRLSQIGARYPRPAMPGPAIKHIENAGRCLVGVNASGKRYALVWPAGFALKLAASTNSLNVADLDGNLVAEIGVAGADINGHEHAYGDRFPGPGVPFECVQGADAILVIYSNPR